MTDLTEVIEHLPYICIEITFLSMFCRSIHSRIFYQIESILNLLQSWFFILLQDVPK